MQKKKVTAEVIDVSQASYEKRLLAISLQGIVNQREPKIYLDYGI